jgi:hypothetical protein
VKKLNNLDDLYNATIENYNEISKDDALSLIRELIYTIEELSPEMNTKDLENTLYHVNEILCLNDEDFFTHLKKKREALKNVSNN